MKQPTHNFLGIEINQLRFLFNKTGAKKIYFAIGVTLTLLATLFEALSITLLIPTLKGIAEMNFGFVSQLPILSNIINAFPTLFIKFNTSVFILLITLIFISIIIKNVFAYTSSLCFAYQTTAISHNLRRFIFYRYIDFGKMFFDKENKGHLQTVLNNFTSIIAQKLTDFYTLLMTSLTLLMYVAVMFYISWKLTLFILPFLPILYISLTKIIQKIKKTSHSKMQSSKQLNEHTFNVLSSVPLVKSYNMEKKEKMSFTNLSKICASFEFSQMKKTYLIGPLQEIILTTAVLTLVSIIAFLVIKTKTIDITSFLVFFYVLKRSSTIFGLFNGARGSLAEMSGPLNEVMKVFDNNDKHFITEGTKKFSGLKREIKFDKLSFSYTKQVPLLKDVTFLVQKGGMTAIVGPTGSGKTTIINLLMRFYEIKPTTIKIDGVDIHEYTSHSLRSHIALVSQDSMIFNDTIKANIVYGLEREVSEEEITEILKKARLYNYVIKLPEGLNTLVGDSGVKLSGGEKQRLSIARALLKKAEILILDEATSSLDSETEHLVQEAIDECIKGKTSIVIAHRLSTIKNANKIIVLKEGKVVEEGKLKELITKKGLFYSFWKRQKF